MVNSSDEFTAGPDRWTITRSEAPEIDLAGSVGLPRAGPGEPPDIADTSWAERRWGWITKKTLGYGLDSTGCRKDGQVWPGPTKYMGRAQHPPFA